MESSVGRSNPHPNTYFRGKTAIRDEFDPVHEAIREAIPSNQCKDGARAVVAAAYVCEVIVVFFLPVSVPLLSVRFALE